MKTCPRCGEEYNQYPALSRVDNETEICPSCGAREAIWQMAFPKAGLPPLSEPIPQKGG